MIKSRICIGLTDILSCMYMKLIMKLIPLKYFKIVLIHYSSNFLNVLSFYIKAGIQNSKVFRMEFYLFSNISILFHILQITLCNYN